MQYDIAIHIQGNIVEQITVNELYIRSWFKLSRHCPDAGLSNRTRKLLEHYLEEQAAKLPVLREIVLDKKGWCRIEENNVYCRNNTIICKAINGVDFKNPAHNIIRIEDFKLNVTNTQAFLEGIKETAKGTSWIMYLVSYFDILKNLFRKAGHPIEFIINIHGLSGSGKTSLIKTLCSPSQIFSFRSAKRRDTILRETKEFEGHTVLFDDYHPAENKADRDRQNGIKDSLVRMVEELPDAPNILISSEYLDGHMSLQDRELQIFLDKNMDWEHYTDRKNAYRNTRYAAYIRCANYLFHEYFIKPYGIKWQYSIDTDLQVHMAQQERHMKIVTKLEHSHSYMPILRDMLLDEENNGLERILDWNCFTCDSKTYYVNPKKMVFISLKALQRGLMVYLRSGHIPLKKIIKEMADANILEIYETGNEYTKKCTYGRYYEINTQELEEYCSLFE